VICSLLIRKPILSPSEVGLARQPTIEPFDAGLGREHPIGEASDDAILPLAGLLNGLALSILLWYAIGLVVALLSL